MNTATIKRHHKIEDSADRLVCEKIAADMLAVSPRTLQGWRVRGGGPEYVKFGTKVIRYRVSALTDFIDVQTRANTSAFGGAR